MPGRVVFSDWQRARDRKFADSPLEEDGFEPSVPPSKRRQWSGGPRSTIVVSRDDLCLMTHPAYQSGISVPATAERSFRKSGTDSSNPAPSSGESSELQRTIGELDDFKQQATSLRRTGPKSHCDSKMPITGRARPKPSSRFLSPGGGGSAVAHADILSNTPLASDPVSVTMRGDRNQTA
jgi:hypothetical protein